MATKSAVKKGSPEAKERMRKAREARAAKNQAVQAEQDVVYATGICHCRNKRWVKAFLKSGESVRVNTGRPMKSPRGSVLKCKKVQEPNYYETVV